MRMLHSLAARTAQEGYTKEAHEAAQRQRPGKAKQNKGQRRQQTRALSNAVRSQRNKALQHQPLAGEAVGQRNCCQRHRADEGKRSGIRHLACQTAEQLQVLAACAMHNAACAHKHQHLHNAVVERMHQRSHKA